jgi:hypothetical protein
MTNHSTDHSRRTPMQLCGKRPDQSSNQGYTVTEMASPHLSRWLMAVMISSVSDATLAFAGAKDGAELRSVVRLVNGGHL